MDRSPAKIGLAALAFAGLLAFVFSCRVCFEFQRHVQININKRSGVSHAAPATSVRKRRVAIVLCKFLDKPSETRPPSFYEDYYTRRGTGGLADYWNDVTLGALDLSESKVMGWFTMTHNSHEVKSLVFPGGRNSLVQWGKDTATANHVDLAKFDGVLVVQNWGVDHGAAGNGVVIVDQNASLIESTFIAHEMGHLFGLGHSFGEDVSPCISASGEYCDAWDIMSAMNAFAYPDTFEGASGTFGPGLNAFATKALGGLSGDRLLSIHKSDFSETIELFPLNQSLQPGGRYAVEITAPASNSTYMIEYRHKAGWDRGLPFDAVLVHEVKKGRSYLKHTVNNSSLLPGQSYVTAKPTVYVKVLSIDSSSQKATLQVWDLPDNALRQELSDANIYLIRNGRKLLVTSAALRQLGRSSEEIRTVPDGALSNLPAGRQLN